MGYSVTKAAGLHLMKCLASTQGPKVRVNAVLPGLLLTEWVSLPRLQILFPGAVNVTDGQPGPAIPRREDPSH